MLIALANGWWLLVLRGIAGLLLGMAACMQPGINLTSLAALYTAYALIDGAFGIAGAILAFRADERWGILFVDGVASVSAGLAAFPWPGVTLPALIWVIAPRAMMAGVAQTVTAERLRKCTRAEWMPAVAGTISVLFGVAMAVAPVARVPELAMWFGGYVLIAGFSLIVFGHWLRAWVKSNNLGDYVAAPIVERSAPFPRSS
jgi:uncharacterized membrane protein HdeD (DUF308 family)